MRDRLIDPKILVKIAADAIISKSQMRCGSYPLAIPVNASSRETNHNGGKVVVGPDKNGQHNNQAQNVGMAHELIGTCVHLGLRKMANLQQILH